MNTRVEEILLKRAIMATSRFDSGNGNGRNTTHSIYIDNMAAVSNFVHAAWEEVADDIEASGRPESSTEINAVLDLDRTFIEITDDLGVAFCQHEVDWGIALNRDAFSKLYDFALAHADQLIKDVEEERIDVIQNDEIDEALEWLEKENDK
jgi:hypothetical protein